MLGPKNHRTKLPDGVAANNSIAKLVKLRRRLEELTRAHFAGKHAEALALGRRVRSIHPEEHTSQWDLSTGRGCGLATAEVRVRENQALAEARAARASGWATRVQ